MPERVPDRFVWAMEVMRIAPTDRVLEVGCGHGIAAALVCERLDGGRLLALDRSATMTETAGRRNRRSVEAGVAELRTTTLAAAELEAASFDVVFAVNVSLFWTPPADGLAVVSRALAPGGRLYVFHQGPVPQKDEQVVEAATALLTGAGWTVHETLRADTAPVGSVCVVAGR
ncbi:class I SAM-dependent methyltransferase [Cellulomonas xylanilytica]|uniref:Methyltransferase type 12 domain-containing protein n=1 Tax=Cellulomonas xylanilytica TaxID=233583 RepID=A0A510UZX9_9CELL|nr:class I SAM-dependent methyltransferase [Cellulomonas xylanilytica]GEK20149.1 hypothetical protein CXY01_06690 [Cellulomonas xylanilytica]